MRRGSGLKNLSLLFANPLVALLLVAGPASALVGDYVNASIIVVIVLLSVTFNHVQTARSERTAEKLRKEVAPTVTSLRDGAWKEIPRRKVVPGDIIRLSAGDLVPADALLLTSKEPHVQQAALTGESLPVERESEGLPVFTSDSPLPGLHPLEGKV